MDFFHKNTKISIVRGNINEENTEAISLKNIIYLFV